MRTNSLKLRLRKPVCPKKTKPEARNWGDRKVGIEEHNHLLKRLKDGSKEERKSKTAWMREGLYQFHSSSSSWVLVLEDVVVSLPPSGRGPGFKVVGCGFLESGVIALAMRIVSSLSSSRREGDKGEVGRGVLSVRETGGADPIGMVGAFHHQ